MYKYETHLHTSPVSRCAEASVGRTLKFYKKAGYDGVFITNHFIDSNIGIDRSNPYEECVDFLFSDYEEALRQCEKIGIKVFFGTELGYLGTDFLVYGLDKAWFLAHPEIMSMPKRQELEFMMASGALVIHAHPCREANYIDHLRLYPRSVHGVETINSSRTDFENRMADVYADCYGLLKIAGSDNHVAEKLDVLAGIMTEEPLCSTEDFIDAVKNHKTELFITKNIWKGIF